MSRPAVLFLAIIAPALSICLALLGLKTLGKNMLGWFLLVLGIAYLSGMVIYTFIRREPFWNSTQPSKKMLEETNDRSFWLILPGFLVIFFASPLEWLYLPGMVPRLSWMPVAGLALILTAMALRVWMRAHLRGLYSGHVEVQADHRLVKSGPYRFVRHPGYTGFVIMTLGLCIGYSSLIGLIAVPVLLMPGLAYRMKVEERLLTGQFGDEYRAYMNRTKKLIPWVW